NTTAHTGPTDQNITALVSYSQHPLGAWPNGSADLLYIDQNGFVVVGLYGAPELASSTAVNDGKWHNVVWTHSGTQGYLYLDGVQVATKAGTFISPQGCCGEMGDMYADYVGAGPGIQDFFKGTLGDFAYYHSQLSSDEVAAQYAAAHFSAGMSP